MAMKKATKKPMKNAATKKSAAPSPKSAKSSAGKKKPASGSKSKPGGAKKASGALTLGEVAPGLTVNDVEKSLAWYRDVVGFAVEERWEREGKLMGVSLKAGSVTVMIGQDDWKKGRDRKKGEGIRLYLSTNQNVDEVAKKMKEKGGTLDQEPTDQPWGMRDFSFTDPDGYKLTIGAETKKKR